MASLFRGLYDFPETVDCGGEWPGYRGGTGWPHCATSRWPCRRRNLVHGGPHWLCAGDCLQHLVAIVGEKRARDLLLTGRVFGAEEALRFGFGDEIVPA